MIKKTLVVLFVCAIAVFVTSCGAKPNYDDVRAAIDKEVATIGTFASGVDAATDAASLATAINGFVDTYKGDVDAFKAVLAKHTEASGKDVPPELQDAFKKLTDANAASGAALNKVVASQFASDPAVVDALSKVQALQASLAQ